MNELKLISPNRLPKDTDYLWRYMDLHKFMNFLYTKNIRFSRMDTFEDPLEGIPYETLIKARQIGEGINIGDFVLGNYESIIPVDVKTPTSRLGQIISIQKSHFVTCWFLEQTESMAMWNLYSNENGIALKMKFSDLKDNLKPEFPRDSIKEYFCGKVSYQNLRNDDPLKAETLKKIKRIALRKDDSYSHEKEIRFVVKVSNSDVNGIFSKPLALSKLDFNIIPHPKMSKWKIDNINELLKSKKLSKKLKKSTIRLRY